MEHRCDKFVEMVGWSHRRMADRIRDDNINVLIDTTGYTMNMQTEVFAIGPSPVQVGGCGCGCVCVCVWKVCEYKRMYVHASRICMHVCPCVCENECACVCVFLFCSRFSSTVSPGPWVQNLYTILLQTASLRLQVVCARVYVCVCCVCVCVVPRTLSHTHTLSLSLTHSLTHSLTDTHTHTRTHTRTHRSCGPVFGAADALAAHLPH
jgi:hypothetical protein